MDEQCLPIGIDSELEHVQSEVDRVDGMFSVATGPMGHQELNYHTIDDERDHPMHRKPTLDVLSITESRISSFPDARPIDVADSKTSHNIVPPKTISLGNTRARFTLPEIDSSNQPDKKYPLKKMYTSSKRVQKEQTTFDETVNTHDWSADEQQRTTSMSSLNESTMDIPEQCRPSVNNALQQQAATLVPFYTLNELAQHNDLADAWICIFGHIHDVTSLINKAQDPNLYQQLMSYAGHDISVWFDETTGEPRRRIDRFTHESVSVIDTLPLEKTFGTPFWQTGELRIGQLSLHPRYIRLIHHFAPNRPYVLEVAEEETIGQIAVRFLKHNSHIFSYLWRHDGQILDYAKTLTENGIPTEELFHDRYGWRSDNENCPTIILCFSDDLTVA